MRSIIIELWRGAAVGMMIGLLIGFIVGLFMGFGLYFGFGLLAFLGVSGAAVAVAATIIYRGVQIAGFRRIWTRAIGWAAAGVVIGPLLYWWEWSNNMFTCTIASVVLLALFAAVNEALDALVEQQKAHSTM